MANNAIALLAKTPDFETPVESQTKALNLQQMMRQAQLGDYQLQDAQQARIDDQAMRQAFAQNGSTEDRLAALAKGGNYKAYQTLAKSDVEQKKAAADVEHLGAQSGKLKSETGTIDYDLRIKKADTAIKDISSFNSPQEAIASLKLHAAAGDVPMDQAQMILQSIPKDPAKFPAWQLGMLKNILSAKEKLSFEIADANTVLNNKTSRANNSATIAQSERSSLRADARAREQLQQGKVPTGYRANPDGSLSFIPGGPADPKSESGKAPTEFQGKSAAFGARAEEADRILTGLTGKYSPAAVNSKVSVGSVPVLGGVMGAVTNKFAMNESDQKAEQAQRDFINAVLRQESGAAIGASEFDNASKQYFPQPGDTAGVITQKAKNRKLAIEGFKHSAGKASFSAPADAGDIYSQADAILRGK